MSSDVIPHVFSLESEECTLCLRMLLFFICPPLREGESGEGHSDEAGSNEDECDEDGLSLDSSSDFSSLESDEEDVSDEDVSDEDVSDEDLSDEDGSDEDGFSAENSSRLSLTDQERMKILQFVLISNKHIVKKMQCAVCLEHFCKKETVICLPCKHFYHKQCIIPWCKWQSTCPYCRKSVDERFEKLCRMMMSYL